MAGHGVVRHGEARRGMSMGAYGTGTERTKPYLARLGRVRRGVAGLGKARTGLAGQGAAWRGPARLGKGATGPQLNTWRL